MSRPISILVVASFFKGNRFMEECKRQGCQVYLLTKLSLKDSPWPREAISDTFYMPEFTKREDVINAVSFLARTHEFDAIVPMDDFDVELAASLREHLRIPGMGDTTARYFRDKLAMRVQARDENIRCPRFEHVLNYDRLNRFMKEVPGPWMLKPRSEAGSVGIKKIHEPAELWQWVERLGDEQSHRLLEEFVAGSVCHVDSIVWKNEIKFAHASRYAKPPFDIWNNGGIFVTHSIRESDPLYEKLIDANRRVVKAMGLVRGVTHAEFILAERDGEVYFLEIAARVGGASIDIMIEAATGLNMWEEWAKVETAYVRHEDYKLPKRRHDYAALLVSLAKQANPDTSSFNDPEVFWRMHKDHHVGLVIAGSDPDRIDQLTEDYRKRFAQEFLAVEPPFESFN